MRYFCAFLLVMLLASSCAANVYNIRTDLSEQQLQNLYVDMLYKFTRHAETLWQDSEPGIGYWGTGKSDWKNEGIRAVSGTALAYAVLVKHSNVLSKDQRAHYLNRAKSGIRHAAETHVTGTRKCTDDKQWGNSWQSTMWTANLGFAAWMIWDELDEDLRITLERVITYEADRLLVRKPNGNRWGNTRAEEIAWDQMVVSLATNMFPAHKNAAGWREKSIEWMMNTIPVPADFKDESIVDGKPVKDWVITVNAHPDHTIENHGFFHPSYAMGSPAMVGQGAFYYAFAGRTVPQAASHHVLDNWRMLQAFMHPHGYWGFAQGMDWALNSDGHIYYLAYLSTYFQDPVAAGMEKLVAQYIAGHQSVHKDGTFAGPSSRLGFAREAIVAERLTYSYMYHRIIGSPPQPSRTIREAACELNGVRRYVPIDVITHRTGSKFTSFSWKNKIMGYVMPIGPGHEGNPYFTTPNTSSLVGNFILEDPAKGTRTLRRVWKKTDSGFETEGVIATNGDMLKQEIRFASIGEKTVVYVDRVVAQADVSVKQELGSLFGIENDEFCGDKRTLYHQNGSQVIQGPETEALIRIQGNWVNLDGRMGIVSAAGSGLVYQDVADYNRDGGREDFLYCSYSDEPRQFKSGDEIARRITVFYVETTPQDTAKLAGRVRVDNSTPDEPVLLVPLPEGGEARVSLKMKGS